MSETKITENLLKNKEKKILLAFHGDPELKATKIREMKEHMRLDEISQKNYVQYQDGKYKGCAVACTLAKPEKLKYLESWIYWKFHSEYEKQLGIPESIAYLEDTIFEKLSVEESKKFPLEFLEAITVGADLSDVPRQLMIWLLVDSENGVINFVPEGGSYSEQAATAITNVAQLLENNVTDVSELRKAAEAAEAASAASAASAYAAREAACAAREAASAYAASAAKAAAKAAVGAAVDASSAAAVDAAVDASSAAAKAAAKVSTQEYYLKIKYKLLELLKEAI